MIGWLVELNLCIGFFTIYIAYLINSCKNILVSIKQQNSIIIMLIMVRCTTVIIFSGCRINQQKLSNTNMVIAGDWHNFYTVGEACRAESEALCTNPIVPSCMVFIPIDRIFIVLNCKLYL